MQCFVWWPSFHGFLGFCRVCLRFSVDPLKVTVLGCRITYQLHIMPFYSSDFTTANNDYKSSQVFIYIIIISHLIVVIHEFSICEFATWISWSLEGFFIFRNVMKGRQFIETLGQVLQCRNISVAVKISYNVVLSSPIRRMHWKLGHGMQRTTVVDIRCDHTCTPTSRKHCSSRYRDGG